MPFVCTKDDQVRRDMEEPPAVGDGAIGRESLGPPRDMEEPPSVGDGAIGRAGKSPDPARDIKRHWLVPEGTQAQLLQGLLAVPWHPDIDSGSLVVTACSGDGAASFDVHNTGPWACFSGAGFSENGLAKSIHTLFYPRPIQQDIEMVVDIQVRSDTTIGIAASCDLVTPRDSSFSGNSLHRSSASICAWNGALTLGGQQIGTATQLNGGTTPPVKMSVMKEQVLDDVCYKVSFSHDPAATMTLTVPSEVPMFLFVSTGGNGVFNVDFDTPGK